MAGSVEYLSPEGLHRSPAYSQVVVTRGAVRTVYVGGQNAVDAAGNIVGRGDIGAQSEQAVRNVLTALAAGGAGPEHVVQWRVYLVQGQNLQAAFAGYQRVLGPSPKPALVTGLFVAGLAHPDYLVEVEALAVVPEE